MELKTALNHNFKYNLQFFDVVTGRTNTSGESHAARVFETPGFTKMIIKTNQVERVFSNELKTLRRSKEKLQIKNGVLQSQQVKIASQIRQLLAKAEVTEEMMNQFLGVVHK